MNRTALAIMLSTVMTFILSGSASAYPVPDMEGAKLVLEETQIIADRDPSTEITIRTYTKADGSRFRVYSVGGNVFRYDIDEDGVLPYEYRILDEDGDGSFETREMMVGQSGGGGESYYIDLGSEPGKEYRYRYQDNETFKEREHSDHRTISRIMEGFSIYIPAWVLVDFD